ncbi:MAG: hypothetical protein HWN67_22430 [Candidatus Helarchaeota archaeon]|nr:hypothetical protein [Candidatus Helarchaeota archaeon]
MSVKSPLSDDVFARFIDKTSAAKLEKKFAVKGVKFEKTNISAAESVKNVVKSAVFFFRSQFSPEKAAKTYEEVDADLKKLEKTRFYQFKKNVNPVDWNGEDTLPMYDSISSVNCKKCVGKGYKNCDKCGGTGEIKCKKCEGKGLLECKKCKGTGQLKIEIEVVDEPADKKDKKPMNYQCGECLGSGKLACSDCGGGAKSVCGDCKPNMGKFFCKECNGTGKRYKYRRESIPFVVPKGEFIPHLFFKPEIEKQIGEELGLVINSVDGIYIKKLDEMDEKFVKAQLGYWDGDIKGRMNSAKNLFKELQKKKGPESPKFPIYLFPLLRLEVKTVKGKKFDILSIGTEKGYDVFVPKF